MIGAKIRDKRKEVGLSLKELAEKTNLTPGFLSQIERDLAEPSITSLRKLSEALGVAVFYFLMDDLHKNPVVKKGEGKILNFRHSHVNYELLSPDLNRQMEMFKAELEPGAMTCEEPLCHPGEEVTHVLQGKMLIIIGDQEYTLEEGDTIYYFCSIPHKIVSVGDVNLIFISTITPPEF
ncbi:XRE family transcriptional regulator [Natranaerovirga pectinivora]|uniref:XRE family transcriptional regulator n=1 Tax=Natranaerovirga pectinivora TaxID=682400 RepID=A0A4R3MRD5_9FIRM|nr:XRE family transcriptional regulator [Natranaerovirga pectinivora]TCT16748.1 XRE family transcriptional regulator [Natranaerovirga pectinivora]